MKPINKKRLIVELLIQDMKHEQLIDGLSKLGFQSDLHGLDLAGVVAELMGIPKMEIMNVYSDFLGQAVNYEITGDGKNLVPLAQTCYTFLTACIKEKRKQ